MDQKEQLYLISITFLCKSKIRNLKFFPKQINKQNNNNKQTKIEIETIPYEK